jgi:hypothetical protein
MTITAREHFKALSQITINAILGDLVKDNAPTTLNNVNHPNQNYRSLPLYQSDTTTRHNVYKTTCYTNRMNTPNTPPTTLYASDTTPLNTNTLPTGMPAPTTLYALNNPSHTTTPLNLLSMPPTNNNTCHTTPLSTNASHSTLHFNHTMPLNLLTMLTNTMPPRPQLPLPMDRSSARKAQVDVAGTFDLMLAVVDYLMARQSESNEKEKNP